MLSHYHMAKTNPSSLERIGPLTFREDRSFIICSGPETFRVFYFQKRNREWPGKTSTFFHRLFNVVKSPLTFHQSHRTLYLIAASFTQQHSPSHNRFACRVLMLQKFPLPSMVKLFGACKGNPSAREWNLCQSRHLPIHPVSSQPLLTATSHSSCKPRDVAEGCHPACCVGGQAGTSYSKRCNSKTWAIKTTSSTGRDATSAN